MSAAVPHRILPDPPSRHTVPPGGAWGRGSERQPKRIRGVGWSGLVSRCVSVVSGGDREVRGDEIYGGSLLRKEWGWEMKGQGVGQRTGTDGRGVERVRSSGGRDMRERALQG